MKRNKTPRVCLAVVTDVGEALEDELQTEEICMAAVKQNGEALKTDVEAVYFLIFLSVFS